MAKTAKRILVVEDSPTQAQMLKHILESAEYTVDTAHDGKEGLAKFQSMPYHLVISDVVMPEMSGYELCKKIKSDSSKDTQVLLVTMLNDLKDVIEGLRCGADNFITKPYEVEYLLDSVRSIIQSADSKSGEVCDTKTGVCYMDNKFVKSLDRKRILDYLVSTFDEFLRARQRESQIRLQEAQHRQESIREREDLIAALVHDLCEPLSQDQDLMDDLLSGKHGTLNSDQLAAIRKLRRNQENQLAVIERLVLTLEPGWEADRAQAASRPAERFRAEATPQAAAQRLSSPTLPD